MSKEIPPIEIDVYIQPSREMTEGYAVVTIMEAVKADDENCWISIAPAKQRKITSISQERALWFRNQAITIMELTKGHTPEQIAAYSNAMKSMLDMTHAVLALTNDLPDKLG